MPGTFVSSMPHVGGNSAGPPSPSNLPATGNPSLQGQRVHQGIPGVIPQGPPSNRSFVSAPPPLGPQRTTSGGAPLPPYGQPSAFGPPPPMGAAYEQSSILTQFQTLTLGPGGPGQPAEIGIDPSAFARPCGADPAAAAAPPQLQVWNASHLNLKNLPSELFLHWSMSTGSGKL